MSTILCRVDGKLQFRKNVKPNKKQALLFRATTKYVAYGGARGGGKSWALRVLATLLCLKYEGLTILLLRRTYPELESNHIIPLMKELKGIAEYKSSQKRFMFGNGSIIKLGYCDSDKDAISYQGQEYDVICFEEATLFSEFMLDMIKTCLRSTRKDGFKTRVYYTCNPGGLSHHYIKRLFIDREYEGEENADDYTFIPALIYDNEVLMYRDPGYLQILDTMPEELRAAHRDGDWDALSGAFFKEFKRAVHVVEPFEIPSHWYRYFVLDYGLDCTAALWIAHDYERDKYYVYKELWQKDLIISRAAEEILKRNGRDKPTYWFAPPDFKQRKQDTGKTAIELFRDAGVPLILTKNDRLEGWLCVKEALKVITKKEEDRYCRDSQLKIFSNCTMLIKHLPIAQRDEKKPNDVALEPHEITHIIDALRYFCIEYIKLPKLEEKRITGVWHRQELKMHHNLSDAQIKHLEHTGQIRLIGK